MPAVDRYAVQTFTTNKKGSLLQGRLINCEDSEEARRVAEQKVSRGEAVGAAAFLRQCYDDEFDDGSEPITLATFGRVPSGVADQLPF